MKSLFVLVLSIQLLVGCYGATSCFVADTQVFTPNGSVPIQDIQVGDLVWSWDLQKNQLVKRKVTQTFQAKSTEVYHLQFDSNRTIGVTAEHPIYSTKHQTFVPAEKLNRNTSVLVATNTQTMDILKSKKFLPGEHTVYNIEVSAPEHNFFANKILVHNKSPLPMEYVILEQISQYSVVADTKTRLYVESYLENFFEENKNKAVEFSKLNDKVLGLANSNYSKKELEKSINVLLITGALVTSGDKALKKRRVLGINRSPEILANYYMEKSYREGVKFTQSQAFTLAKAFFASPSEGKFMENAKEKEIAFQKAIAAYFETP